MLTGRSSIALALTSKRLTHGTVAVGVGATGGILVLGAGAIAGTGRGVPLIGALLAVTVIAASTLLYIRDPVRALIGLWLIVVLNSSLSTLVGYNTPLGEQVRQADELFVVLLVGLTVWRTIQTDTPIRAWAIIPTLAIALGGILSAVFHQVPFSVASVGMWLGLKLWTMIVVATLLPWKPGDLERIYKTITAVGVFVAGLGFVDYLTHGAASSTLHLGIPYAVGSTRSNAVHSIFSVPNEFSLFMSMLFALSFTRFAIKHSRADLALALMYALSIVLSLRLKGFLSLAVVVMIVAVARAFARDAVQRRRAVVVAVVGCVVLISAYALESKILTSQVSHYTSTSSTARAKLYTTGEQIAADNFPLGVGFGRFASYESRLHYSPVYDQYYLSSTYGLSRAQPEFIDDVSWPSVIAETGYLGFTAYVVGILVLIGVILRRLRAAAPEKGWPALAALCLLAVVITDSLGDPTLFDWVPAITLALIFGPALFGRQKTEKG